MQVLKLYNYKFEYYVFSMDIQKQSVLGEEVRLLLNSELQSRIKNNSSYSLRAFARNLKLDHSTLSKLLTGQRKISSKTILHIGEQLGLSQNEITDYLNSIKPYQTDFVELAIDDYSSVCDWHFDAILELTRTKGFKPNINWVANRLGLDIQVVDKSVNALVKNGYLKVEDSKWVDLSIDNMVGIEPIETTEQLKSYQKNIILKSLEAVDKNEKPKRNHTANVLTVNEKDLPAIYEKITKFRHDLAKFIQREGCCGEQVYALQVGFFPLSEDINHDQNYGVEVEDC